jgi:hypothetical protein
MMRLCFTELFDAGGHYCGLTRVGFIVRRRRGNASTPSQLV